MKSIVFKENNGYIVKDVYGNALFGYPEKIQLEPTKSLKYDSSHIYETYDLDILE